MTKGAVATLVRGLARDLAPRAITVNNLQPGPTETDMNADLPDWARKMVPVGRIASPAEIAGFAAYLASAEAGYVTGASLTIDGGFSL
jgi:3-oxoacyl-[acyl-carrier protein] reductase